MLDPTSIGTLMEKSFINLSVRIINRNNFLGEKTTMPYINMIIV